MKGNEFMNKGLLLTLSNFTELVNINFESMQEKGIIKVDEPAKLDYSEIINICYKIDNASVICDFDGRVVNDKTKETYYYETEDIVIIYSDNKDDVKDKFDRVGIKIDDAFIDNYFGQIIESENE